MTSCLSVHMQDAENRGQQGAQSPAAAEHRSVFTGRLPLVAVHSNRLSLAASRASLRQSPVLCWRPDGLVASMDQLVRHNRAGNQVRDCATPWSRLTSLQDSAFVCPAC